MKKNIQFLIVIAFSTISLFAQNNNITPPLEDDVVVGSIGGNVDVSAFGGATYSIPIQIPEGIDGMQPNLSIVYNSQSGNGLLGWGWNIGGLSSITRVGQTNYHDGKVTGVSLDYHDRFALDGQRLMVLDGASYGSNCAEYKTEVDGMSRIISYADNTFNGPKSFKIWTADGKILEYGNDDNARIVYEDNSGQKTVVMWLLNRIENREGNYVVYNYEIHEHDYLLSNIQYSGHPGAKTTIYGIDFHYFNNRVDKECLAIGNYLLYQPRLLKDISIYHWSKPLSKYEFVYDENSGQIGSRYYYNRLTSIHYEYEGLSYNPTSINWGEYPVINNTSFASIDEMYVSTIDYGFQMPVSIEGQVKFVGDFNGDGLQDLICVERPSNQDNTSIIADTNEMRRGVHKAHAFVNKGFSKTDEDGGELRFEHIGMFSVPYNLRWIYVCDFDGDCIDEVLFVGENTDFYNGKSHASYDVFKICPIDNGTAGNELETKENVRLGASFEPFSNSDYTFSIFGYGSDFIWGNGSVLEFYITEERNYSFIVGDFLGKGHNDIIFTFPYKHFVYIYYDEQSCMFRQETSIADWNGIRYVPGDFDGDGITEVWFDSEFDDDPGIIAKVYINSQERFSWFSLANMMDCWNRNYTGDFNGDGHTDFLTYRKDTKTWQILLFKQDWHSYPVFDVTGIMHQYFGNEDPNDANYSIEGKSGLSLFLEVTDVDGDGKSDVMLRNNPTQSNYKCAVLYGPPIGNGFARVEEFNPSEIGMVGETTPGLCVGNFLAQENTSLIRTNRLYSFPQHSIYYNVENIIDGMGNKNSFEYDYLVHNPMKENELRDENIYKVTDIGIDHGFNVYNVSLPIKAVSSLVSSNVNLESGAFSIDSCSYENALMHKKGKGLLGFQKTVHDNWLEQNAVSTNPLTKHQAKNIKHFNVKPMGEHCMNLLEQEELFRYQTDTEEPGEYEEIMVANSVYGYQKFICSRNNGTIGSKVFMPMIFNSITDRYELLGERSMLCRQILTNAYNGLGNFGTAQYLNTVYATETWQGTNADEVYSAEDCEFQTHTIVAYENDLINEWIINRPQSIYKETTRLTHGYASDKSLIRYVYNSQKPYLPKAVFNYPSGIMSSTDRLASKTEYSYIDGRIQFEKISSVNDTLKPRVTTYEYDPYYRFTTKVTNSYGHETSYQYDNVYGTLINTTDCNGYQSVNQNEDHLGITVRHYNTNNDETHSRINGTESVSAIRWLEGSAYEQYAYTLTDAFYFSWTKSEGKAETITIFDALGRELRTVTFGLRETGSNAIYQDTQYDVWGRVYKKSEPYYSDTHNTDIKWTTYEYDNFDRIIKTNYPPFMLDEELIEPFTAVEYEGLKTTTETGAETLNGTVSHTIETMINIMGWTDYNKEYLDPELQTYNTTTYGYNANGSLAWAKVNGDECTKITMLYDDAGNRCELNDPDYGITTTQYDAFGQLQLQDTPKGDRTIYHYDNIGRLVIRSETDNEGGSPVTETTTWEYSNTNGTKGLLASVALDNRQEITYTYDPLHYNNLQEVTEELHGTEYTTCYQYSDNNYPQRISSVTYPSGYTVDKSYDVVTGRLKEIHHNNQLLWKTYDANALGQITHFEMGNGVHSYYQYDDRHHLITQQASNNGNTIQGFSYNYDIFGNLAGRTEDKYNMPITEEFVYDNLNRLKSITLNGTVNSNMVFDAHGRIINKEVDGQTVFSNVQYNSYDHYNNLKPHAISSATMVESLSFAPSLEITYTMFDKVKSLRQYDSNGGVVGHVRYQYGHDHERVSMDKGETYEKLYLGNCELITQNGSTRWNTFISGPLGVFAAVTSNGTSESLCYIYKDHLGSWTTITDDAGTLLQEMSYDAWGNLRNPYTWTSGPYSGLILYDRGFTGHEHLFDYGLINMNGRMYDPVMSSFLSVDSYVQAPDFSQSFNRYAYCLNNPLKYTDPSGESFVAAMLITGAVIGAYTGGVLANNNYNPCHWDFGSADTWRYMVCGGLVGAASAYAGIYVAGLDIPMCNTLSYMAYSTANSVGTYLYTGGQTNLTVSFGVASLTYSPKEKTLSFGYPFKKGNNFFDNISYCMGALYNFTDLYRLVTWDSNSYYERCELLKEASGHADDDCISYIENLPNNDVACYNLGDNDIYMASPAFSKGRGWASSSLDHEWNHMERFDWQEYNLGNYNKNVDEFYANLTEVNNAAKNGLSYCQYKAQVDQVMKYAKAARLDGYNLSVPNIPCYSFKMYWSWIRRFYGF